MNPLSKNLFLAMAENGRYSHVDAVVNAFGTIMSAHRGEVVCEVTTAKVGDKCSCKSVKMIYFFYGGEKNGIFFWSKNAWYIPYM